MKLEVLYNQMTSQSNAGSGQHLSRMDVHIASKQVKW